MTIQYIGYIRHWFDSRNGCPYFSAHLLDLNQKLLKVFPFQYGNQSHSEDTLINAVQAMSETHEHKFDIRRKIYFNHNDTKKRDCEALGRAIVEGEDD